MRLASAAKRFSFFFSPPGCDIVFYWFKILAGKLKLISKVQAGEYVKKMEHDSDMNLTLVPKSLCQAAELCFEADADKINLDPSDDVS